MKKSKKEIGYIYQIKNLVSGEFYIGSTKNFNNRKYRHFSDLRSNKHRSKLLQKDFNKHGEDNLKMEILEKVELNHIHHLIYLERKYMIEMKPQYNIRFPCFPKIEYSQEDIDAVYHAVNL